MVVLSLFDGMGCGYMAIRRTKLPITAYYASEVDKYAIQQTKANFPDVIHIGDVREVDVSKLQPIDILIGGSPCQSFSFSGKRKGMVTSCDIEILSLEQYLELKNQNFEFEGQSYLFWEYMRILEDIRKYNPNVLFLLENVEMTKKWERVLSEAIGVYGVHINAALVSAQNRKRIYWTNIRTKREGLFGELHTDIPQPKDRGILLKDILETEVDEKYYLGSKAIERAIGNDRSRLMDEDVEKSGAVLANQAKQSTDMLCVAMRGRGENNEQQLEPRQDGKTNTITSVQKDNLVMQINPSLESGGKQPYQQNRIYSPDGISPALCANKADLLIHMDKANTVCQDAYLATGQRNRINGKSILTSQHERRIRRLTVTEAARLQTIDEDYKWVVSDSQAYKMLGNGWCVNVIEHIISFINL